ncbi:MAG: hypothetical protein IIT89_00530 [Aeriscardovia sp.]|nr:hypothetical protein [Aeriscardovia sp.]
MPVSLDAPGSKETDKHDRVRPTRGKQARRGRHRPQQQPAPASDRHLDAHHRFSEPTAVSRFAENMDDAPHHGLADGLLLEAHAVDAVFTRLDDIRITVTGEGKHQRLTDAQRHRISRQEAPDRRRRRSDARTDKDVGSTICFSAN